VDWIEIILGDGKVVEASPQERSDLYYGAAGTFGSLGIVTLLRVQCIPAKPFIKLTYSPFQGPSSRDKALERIAQHVDDGKVDFVDGILFKHNLAVVMTGHLSNNKLSQPGHQTFCRRKDPWFCMHAFSLASTLKPTTITIPIMDYLFRYDRGAFWGGNSALSYFNLPCNKLVRETLDSLLRATPLTRIIHTARLAQSFIVQDLAVPLSNASSFITDVSKFLDLSHHPVWLCPVTNLYHNKPTFTSSVKTSSNTRRPELLIDVGLYGLSFNDSHQFRRINRAIEASLHLHDGQKALFASSFYSEDEFWKVYDREWYQTLRGKYHATSLPNIYEKIRDPLEVVPNAHLSMVVQPCGHSYRDTMKMWLGTFFWSTRPLPGIWGLYKFVLGGDYLLSRS